MAGGRRSSCLGCEAGAGGYHQAGILRLSKVLYWINSGSTKSEKGKPARPELVWRVGLVSASPNSRSFAEGKSQRQTSRLFRGPSKPNSNLVPSGANSTLDTP